VVPNGGRSEQFLIHLPADRIAATDAAAGGLRSPAGHGAMVLPAKFVAQPLLVEHFKVRDSAGSVIGVAARHWSAVGGRATTTWSLLIPSRGAMILNAEGEEQGALDGALRAGGVSPGRAWEGLVTVAMTPAEAGTVAAGTGEFTSLSGSYTESWIVAAVDEAGQVSGTVELNTITRRQL